eukprot:scaffold58616_cov33-Phaeocystis_antarctica.AAC.1
MLARPTSKATPTRARSWGPSSAAWVSKMPLAIQPARPLPAPRRRRACDFAQLVPFACPAQLAPWRSLPRWSASASTAS